MYFSVTVVTGAPQNHGFRRPGGGESALARRHRGRATQMTNPHRAATVASRKDGDGAVPGPKTLFSGRPNPPLGPPCTPAGAPPAPVRGGSTSGRRGGAGCVGLPRWHRASDVRMCAPVSRARVLKPIFAVSVKRAPSFLRRIFVLLEPSTALRRRCIGAPLPQRPRVRPWGVGQPHESVLRLAKRVAGRLPLHYSR